MADPGSVGLPDIARLLSAARSERKQQVAVALFETALRRCDDWYNDGGGTQALIFKAQTYAELALEEQTPTARTDSWKHSLHTLEPKQEQGAIPPDIVEAYALLAVDCFQDVLSDLDFHSRQQILRTARNRLDQTISDKNTPAVSSVLLSRKSSVLRHLALSEHTPDGRLRRLQEASRCASLGLQQDRNTFTVLETGLSEWALAQHEKTDERYAERLRSAERHLTDDHLSEYEPAQIALARFYRLTFQPLKACASFTRQLDRISNPRRIFRESYTLGEAAAQLWFADYPQQITQEYLSASRNLLESAVGAGYGNARIVIALAFVIAIMDGSDTGKTALSEICTRRGVEWHRALQLALSSEKSDLIELGFALGIDQSAVWTRLGTFMSRFVGDHALAEALYRQAIRIDPHYAIALTNLARFLIRNGGPGSRVEARRLLQKAQNFADRRFTWWRAVLAELEYGTAVPPQREGHPQKSPTTAKPSSLGSFVDLKDIRRDFRRVEALANDQERGYELEKLIFELAKLTVGTAAPSYRIQRVGGGISQIDGFFTHGVDKYRVECKWLSKPVDHNDIVAFADKLDVVGVSGVFVSYGGFTEGAVKRAREWGRKRVILLIDGEEVRALFNLQLNFDDVMTRKRTHFDQRSDPYHRVMTPSEAA